MISIGQYQTKLYNDGHDTQSSVCGGLITIVCAAVLIGYAYFMIAPVLKRDTYYLEETRMETERFEYRN
jgi:hypothetical protein